MPSPHQLRVLTWNVHACVGRGNDYRPDRVIAVLHDVNADLLALQEIESRSNLSRGVDQFSCLREGVGGYSVEARTIRTTKGDYGHMVLSRWPIGQSAIHDISVSGREPRAVLDIEVHSPFGPVRFLAVHFGLSAKERRSQTRALQKIAPLENAGATVIAGDFNEWRRHSTTHRALVPPYCSAGTPATFPSLIPMFALDRVWCRSPLTIRQIFVQRSACEASDHLPLIADLDMIVAANSSVDRVRASRSDPAP